MLPDSDAARPTKDDLIAAFRVGSQGGPARRKFVAGRAIAAADGEERDVDDPPLELAPLLAGRACAHLFCARLRRDGYAQLALPPDMAALLRQTEAAAAAWFAAPEARKLEEAGAYGPASGTLAGFARGRNREQLELRLVKGGRGRGVYPALRGGDAAEPALTPLAERSMATLDRVARVLLAHVASDLGASPGFFASLLDPQLPAEEGAAAAAEEEEAEAAIEAEEEAAAAATSKEALEAHAGCPPLRHAGFAPFQNKRAADAEPDDVSRHSGLRACRYKSDAPGFVTLASGRRVACEEHNDVGLLTLDPRASVPGLQAFRQSSRRWVDLEGGQGEAAEETEGLLTVMVGDTLAAVSGGAYT